MSLKEYNRKRNFDKTNEPTGKKNDEKITKNNSNLMLKKDETKSVEKNKIYEKTAKNTQKSSKMKEKRFVIQYHEARAKHYDFRLEYDGVLKSFAVPKGLSQDPKDKRLAVMVEDHPLDYIDFEGIIPRGNYGAGTVEIFDKGTYVQLCNFRQGFKDGVLKFFLKGEKLQGEWSLIRTDEKNWLIVKKDDDFALVEKKKISKLPFKSCGVQLATLTNKIPSGKDWIFEIKYDGYRMLCFAEHGKVKMLSRNGKSYNEKFAILEKELCKIEKENFVLDGEVVAFDSDGRSDFALLQDSIKHGKNDFYYVIFDLLALYGEDLRDLPLVERKEKLERLLFKANSPFLIFSQHVDKGKECFDFAKEHGLEGIIAKKKTSKYLGERNEDWLKVKCVHRQEFVVAGYTTSPKNPNLSAILLGYYDDKNNLVYVGKVGTGLTEELRKALSKQFAKLEQKDCPFKEKIKEKAKWLKCELVAEVKFAEFTKDKRLRQPSFVGLRQDKNAKDVRMESEE